MSGWFGRTLRGFGMSGLRLFTGNFKKPEQKHFYEKEEIPVAYKDEVRDLGLMLYDLDYSDPENINPCFFHAVLRGGVIDLTNCEVFR
jgi:CRISPR-associated protein Cas5d